MDFCMNSPAKLDSNEPTDPKLAAVLRARFTDEDLERARELGSLFGGNGLSHEQQLKLAADQLRHWRECDSVT